jgi:DNA primase
MSAARFDRELLPDALGYYTGEGLRLVGRGTWRSTLCPFHDDHNPSLRVNTETGAFRCMSCGAHGGDVLDFHRQRHGLGFTDAAQALDAWRTS